MYDKYVRFPYDFENLRSKAEFNLVTSRASPKLARRQCDLIPVQPLHTDHTDDLPQKPEAADHQCNNDKIPHTASSHSLFHAALTDSV